MKVKLTISCLVARLFILYIHTCIWLCLVYRSPICLHITKQSKMFVNLGESKCSRNMLKKSPTHSWWLSETIWIFQREDSENADPIKRRQREGRSWRLQQTWWTSICAFCMVWKVYTILVSITIVYLCIGSIKQAYFVLFQSRNNTLI